MKITRQVQIDLAAFNGGVTRARRAYQQDRAAENRPPKPKARLHGPCADCGRHRSLVGRGLCTTCYRRNTRAGTLENYRTQR